MNEEPQVRGCYNFYLHQPGKCRFSPESDAQAAARPATAGTLGKRGRGGDDDEVML